MAVSADVVPRRPTLLFIVVLGLLFILMSLSSRTRYIGETRTMFERTVMTIFSPVPKLVNWVGRNTSDTYHGYLDMRHAVNENLDLHRKVAQLYLGLKEVARPILAAPGVPADRLAALRTAFMMLKDDADFKADAEKTGIEVDPTPAEKIDEYVKLAASASPEVVRRLSEILNPSK